MFTYHDFTDAYNNTYVGMCVNKNKQILSQQITYYKTYNFYLAYRYSSSCIFHYNHTNDHIGYHQERGSRQRTTEISLCFFFSKLVVL